MSRCKFSVGSVLSGFILLATNACKPVAPPISAIRENCEALLEAMLKSPSSLRIVEVRESDWKGDTKDVTIVYDANNSFGASLRGSLACSYLPDPDWWNDTKGSVDMRTDTIKPVPAYRLMPYKLVSDGETIGGNTTEPDLAILMQTGKASDVLRRRREEKK
jgi:hypothetical protein